MKKNTLSSMTIGTQYLYHLLSFFDIPNSRFLHCLSKFRSAVLIVFVSLISSFFASAQYVQQGPYITGMITGQANFGGNTTVAISSDGNTMVKGGGQNGANPTACFVFTRTNGVWRQEGPPLLPNDAALYNNFSVGIAISGDGNTILVGGDGDNNGVGAAWIFTRTNGVWTQQGNKLVGSGYIGTPNSFSQPGFGYRVALAADGNTAIISGYRDNNQTGAVWIFTRSGGFWRQEGSKLVGTGAAASSYFGRSVSISANGNTVMVGADGFFPNGAAWVFIRNNGVWTEQASRLVGNDLASASQGVGVSLSADGNTAAVLGYGFRAEGKVWVYKRTGTVWTQRDSGFIAIGQTVPAVLGCSIALSADGEIIVVGNSHENFDVGMARVFTRRNGLWSRLGNDLIGTGGGPFSTQQGFTVAISADNSTIASGGLEGLLNSTTPNAAWIFTQTSCFNTPRNTTVSAPNIVCLGNSTNLGLDTTYTLNGISYQWQSTRTSGSGYLNLENNFSQSSGALNAPTYFRCLIFCAFGGDTIFTPERLIRVASPSSASISRTLCEGQFVSIGTNVYTNTGIYTAIIRNVAGCDSTVRLNLTVLAKTSANVLRTACQGDTLRINGVNYTLSSTFSSTVMSANGCDSTIFYTLTFNPRYNNIRSFSICQGDSIRINNRYYRDSAVVVERLVSVTGCDSLNTSRLSVVPYLSASRDTIISYLDSIFINKRFITQAGSYTDTIRNAGTPCTSLRTTNVRFTTVPVLMPNAFTPNGDNLNDFFNAVALKSYPNATIQRMRIYDRWGGLVTELTNIPISSPQSSNHSQGWNGSGNSGSPLGSDVYVYILQLVDSNGVLRSLSGEVNLIR
jgi:gliding motility-associated-like protein